MPTATWISVTESVTAARSSSRMRMRTGFPRVRNKSALNSWSAHGCVTNAVYSLIDHEYTHMRKYALMRKLPGPVS